MLPVVDIDVVNYDQGSMLTYPVIFRLKTEFFSFFNLSGIFFKSSVRFLSFFYTCATMCHILKLTFLCYF